MTKTQRFRDLHTRYWSGQGVTTQEAGEYRALIVETLVWMERLEQDILPRIRSPMKYRISFYGRANGAIGLMSNHTTDVEAADERAAQWRAYETHEHITGGVDGVRVQPLYGNAPDDPGEKPTP